MDAQQPDHVEVRRTGGFTGRPASGRITLDPAAAVEDATVAEVQELVARCAFEPMPQARRFPDMFTYRFSVGEQTMVCAEQQLTADLRRLAELVLAQGTEAHGTEA